MPAECLTDVSYKFSVSYGGHSMKLSFQQGKGAHADEYVYQEGSPPSYENEIALTPPAAEQIGVQIGDTVLINIGGEEKEYIITAFYSSMNQMGMYGRLHEDVKNNMSDAFAVLGSQIRFTDHPDSREIQRRIEKIKDILKAEKVYTAAEYVNHTTEVADTVSKTTGIPHHIDHSRPPVCAADKALYRSDFRYDGSSIRCGVSNQAPGAVCVVLSCDALYNCIGCFLYLIVHKKDHRLSDLKY